MFSHISLLTALLFSVLYPLSFLISIKDPLKNNFHRFHLGLPSITGALTVIFIMMGTYPDFIKFTAIVWICVLMGGCFYFWYKETPISMYIVFLAVLGIFLYANIHLFALGENVPGIAAWLLGGMIFCASLYAMNLGHWYLNVHGLPIKHLQAAVFVLRVLLGIRIVWDIFGFAVQKVMYQGDLISLYKFVLNMDGFLLLIAVFFGAIFPFIGMFFADGTLKLKNTQATTGILYVLLCSILIGDLSYKYYSIKFGISL